jgi:hypothetical protein
MHGDNDLDPLLDVPPSYIGLRGLIRNALGFPNERRPLLIGIDGVDGSGKSSLAAWLSWQIEMPALNLEIYIVRDSEQLRWRFDDLSRALDGAQLAPRTRPVIVESVLLLHALQQIGRKPDFHVFMLKEEHKGNMQTQLRSYNKQYQPKDKADHILAWSSADHDARLFRAHYAR